VADHDRAGNVAVLEPAAEDRRAAEHANHARRHQHTLRRYPLTADDEGGGDDVGLEGLDVHRLQHPPQRVHVGRRHRTGVTLHNRIANPNRNELIGFVVRQRREQHAVNDAEDGAVGADAEGECRDAGRGERRLAPDRAHRVANVLKDRFEPRQAAPIAMRFGDRCGAA
jgi:hypothetical protein